MRLRTSDQLLAIDVKATGVRREGISDAPNVAALCTPLLAPGALGETPPVLVCAEPGTGKTWSAVQLTHAMAQQCAQQCRQAPPPSPEEEGAASACPLVPLLVYVQRVSRMLEGRDLAQPLDAATLLQYLALEYAAAERAEWLSMLTMALEMRRVVVVLDGIDEAAGRKKAISSFVREVLVPSGVRVVCTSRPEGVRLKDFSGRFVIFDLKKLTDEQQRIALRQQLATTRQGESATQDGPMGGELSAEVRILSSIDDRLVAALLAGHLRFLRAAWLVAQPDGYCIERRQLLEERERNGETPTPLLSPEEGAALVRCADRRAGAVSYGWATVTHPDPDGARFRVLRRALLAHDHIEGAFWEYATAGRTREPCIALSLLTA